MQRRNFCLSLLAAGGSLGAAAANASAGCADPSADFAAARARNPWTLAFANQAADAEPLALKLHGRLPKGLAGAFFRNGPARHELGGERYRHWFDGDGAIQRFDIGARGITHQSRFVRTPKFEADTAAGRMRRLAFGTRPRDAEPLRSPDSINAANTSVVQHGGRLLALWEGGSATEIDPRTLTTRGFHTWSPELAGMPFSAHPRIEPDGTMWNFGISSLPGLLTLYRIDAGGRLVQTVTQPLPEMPMVHDFAVTERHLVFLLPPLVFDAERLQAGATFLDAHVWRPELGLRVLVIEKARLDVPRWFELPPGFVFHIGNACEEGGVIRLDCMRSPGAWQVQQGFLDTMCGEHRPQQQTQLMLVELDLASGRARQAVLAPVAEFPRVDPRFIGRRYSQLFAAARSSATMSPGFDAVMRVDLPSGRIDRYDYGVGMLVEEHVFVPRPGGAEGQGWLIGSALDPKRRRMLFSIFDASRLSAGPLAQGEMARTLPLGLHGNFVPG